MLDIVNIDPQIGQAKRAAEVAEIVKHYQQNPTPSPTHQTTTNDQTLSFAGIYEGIEGWLSSFPALNLFLVIVTILMILYFAPVVIKRWKER